jgi:hypothetical protein
MVGTGVAGLITLIYFPLNTVGLCALFLSCAFVPVFVRAFVVQYRVESARWRTVRNDADET